VEVEDKPKASFWVKKSLTAKDCLMFGITPADYEKQKIEQHKKL
jgi:hypothetical protein